MRLSQLLSSLCDNHQRAIALGARLLLAATLILSGFVKAVDPLGGQYKLQEYLLALPGTLGTLGITLSQHDSLTLGTAIALSAVECVLGMMLLTNVARRLTAVLTVLFFSAMTLVTLWLTIANPVADCGCFGDALHLSHGWTLTKNIILLLIAIVVLRLNRAPCCTLPATVVSLTTLATLALSTYCLYYLPIIDFRDYHVGADLREQYDFFVSTHEGDDLTDQILEQEGDMLLLIAPYLERASDAHFGTIDQLYDYCGEHNIPFYCLTASGARAIDRWCDLTGAEYPFLLADGTELKTIIRSNPGLLLVRDGVIIKKWSHNALPDPTSLTKQ